jgi:2-polyprenyl-3-methyl-5-hydroxy-6-metoxy-1,4-benzoquinol methylase
MPARSASNDPTDELRVDDVPLAPEPEIAGPFGPARKILDFSVADILAAYRWKCGADVSRSFKALSEINLYECQVTGYKFWRPEYIAADEQTYQLLSASWPGYYRTERWEYSFVRRALRTANSVLEVGCGRGYFLRSIESHVSTAVGLEFNNQAIDSRVTKFDIHPMTVEDYAVRAPASVDAVCSFQVLEHVTDPCAFIKACLDCLRPGGLLCLSTPNMESAMLKKREDAFDLPPHHIGHFSADVYRSIARTLQIEIANVVVESRQSWANDTVSTSTERHFLYRMSKSLSSRMLNTVYRILREPGNNILVIFRRPA